MIIISKFVFILFFVFRIKESAGCTIQSQWGGKQKDVYVNVNLSDIVRRQKQAGIMDMIHFRAQAVMYSFESKKKIVLLSLVVAI